MKYIRTEDGILKVDGYDDRGVCVCSGKTFYRDEYINQADTIEELCDSFVVVGKKHYIWDKQYYLDLSFEQVKQSYSTNDFDFYGAIYTNKGLIYVAKMNDKGCLQLL